MMSFDALVSNLSELEGLMKSLEAAQTDGALDEEEDKDDAAIKAAAGVGTDSDAGAGAGAAGSPDLGPEVEDVDEDEDEDDLADGGDDDALPGGEDAVDDEEDGDGEPGVPFAKSYAVRTADGGVIRAVDGAAALRALQRRMARRDEVMSKALASVTSVLKQQAELIKSLRAEVARGGMAGRGRKAVLTVHDKPAAGTLQKSQPAGVSSQQFLLKALDAQRAGRITGVDVAIAEAALNAGQQVPQHIAAKVLG